MYRTEVFSLQRLENLSCLKIYLPWTTKVNLLRLDLPADIFGLLLNLNVFEVQIFYFDCKLFRKFRLLYSLVPFHLGL